MAKYLNDVVRMDERLYEWKSRCLLMRELVLGDLSRRKDCESDDVEKTHVFGMLMGLLIVGLNDEVWLFEIVMLMPKRMWSGWI